MKIINETEALEVFDRLSAMDLPFAHTRDGCFARAHLMCRKLEDLGLDVHKAWLIEDRAKTMSARIPGAETKLEGLRYHVAPALAVKRSDGRIELMVFDPSFFDGPAEQDEWAFILDDDPPKVIVKPFREAPEGYKGDYRIIDRPEYTSADTDQKAMSACNKHKEKLSDVTERVVFQSNLSKKLNNEGLSLDFKAHTNLPIVCYEQPKIERVRAIPYWERDQDYDDFDCP